MKGQARVPAKRADTAATDPYAALAKAQMVGPTVNGHRYASVWEMPRPAGPPVKPKATEKGKRAKA